MVRARVVPWKDDQEWEEVRSSLYAFIGPDCSEKGARERTKWGVDRIKAWRARSALPPAVDSTASFVEVALRDPHFGGRHDEENDAEPVVTEHELRLLYSMAFVRFVNSFVGTIQQGQFAKSVASLARQLGLPTWFVDLRHVATHEKMPGIALLRNGCSQALSWLDANYWSAQQAHVIKSDTVILALVRQYRSVRVTITLQRPVGAKDVNPHSHMSRILGEIADTISSEEDLNFLLDALVHPIEGFPSAPPELMTDSVCPEPAVVVKLWQPLVRSLAESVEEFAQLLLQRLVAMIASDVLGRTQAPEGAEPIPTSHDTDALAAQRECLFTFTAKLLNDPLIQSHVDLPLLLSHSLRSSSLKAGMSARLSNEIAAVCCLGRKERNVVDKMLEVAENSSEKSSTLFDEERLRSMEHGLTVLAGKPSLVDEHLLTESGSSLAGLDGPTSDPDANLPPDSIWHTYPPKHWHPAPIGAFVSVDPTWTTMLRDDVPGPVHEQPSRHAKDERPNDVDADFQHRGAKKRRINISKDIVLL